MLFLVNKKLKEITCHFHTSNTTNMYFCVKTSNTTDMPCPNVKDLHFAMCPTPRRLIEQIYSQLYTHSYNYCSDYIILNKKKMI